MKIVFRWYGENDSITLEKIRQIPVVEGVVTAVYDVKVGEVWPAETIQRLVDKSEENALSCKVIESVPVHEEIKLGGKDAEKYIEAYKQNIRNLGKCGVEVICYNFMPVFDWTRSDLKKTAPDGSNSLSYSHREVVGINPMTDDVSLPGWDESYTKAELQDLLKRYESVSQEDLWKNLSVFLKEIIPVAEEAGIKMAIHPDDPPWGIFGLPRIITDKENVRRMLDIVPSECNGLTLCTGSLGASKDNDIVEIIKECSGRMPFVHIRNVKRSGEFDFIETAHPSKCGDLDVYEIVKALYDTGFDGYIRPDHGRMIWGESGKPGYGLYDRALGACYIGGIVEAVTKSARK